MGRITGKIGEQGASRLVKKLAGRAGSQDGFMLVEILVAAPIALVVVAASMAALQVSAGGQQRTEGRSQMIIEQKNKLEQITRELRTAERVEPVPAGAWVTNRVRVTTCRDYEACTNKTVIEYRCDTATSRCFRREGTGQERLFSERTIATGGVFRLFWRDPGSGQFQPDAQDPDFVSVRLKTASSWSDQRRAATKPITLEQQVPLRNAGSWEGS